MIRQAERQADAGELQLAAQLCEALFGDDRVSGVYGTRAAALLGLPLSFEESAKGSTASKAARIEEIEADWWTMCPEDELTQLVKWGRCLGVGFGQLRWERTKTRLIPRLEVWHPSLLSWSDKLQTWQIEIEKGKRIPIEAAGGQWVIYTPYGKTRPWSLGLWRGISRWWLLKVLARDDWSRHGEIAAKGIISSPQGTTHEQRLELAEDLANAGGDAQIALPPGFDYKLVEISANTREIYQSQIDAANTAIAISTLGNNLSTEVQGGSFAAASSHAGVSLMHTRSDAETLSTCLREQMLTWWAAHNFGSSEAAPWPKWQTDPPENLAEKANVLATVGTAIQALRGAGMPVDVRQIAEQYSIPLRQIKETASNVTPSARFRAEKTDGFTEGQDYVDALTDKSRELAGEYIAPDIVALKALVADTKDLVRLAQQLRDFLEAMPPEELQAMIERATIMAELAGRHAVLEDS